MRTPGATPKTERGFSMALGRLGDPADGGLPAGRSHQTATTRWSRCCRWCPGDATACRWISCGVPRSPPTAPSSCMVSELALTRRTHRHQPDFAELRDVPVGVRAGRPARCRPGGPVVARVPAVLLALVAAGDAVPVEHEVPAGLGAAVRLLRGRPDDSAGRRRLGDRRGVPGAAVHPPRRSSTPAIIPSVPPTLLATGLLHQDGSAPDVAGAAARPTSPTATSSVAGCPSRCGCDWPS